MRRALLLCCVSGVLGFASCLITQQPKSGEILFEEKNYAHAIDKLLQEFSAATETTVKAKLAFLIGESYRLCGQYVPAEQWYQRSLVLDANQQTEFLYASMLKANEKYEEALQAFSQYVTRYPFDEYGHREIEACQLAMQWKKENTAVHIKALDELNSAASEYAPVFAPEGAMWFTSDRDAATGDEAYGWTGRKFSDLFLAGRLAVDRWQSPRALPAPINTPFNEGAASFSADKRLCLFTRCGSTGPADDYCQIYAATSNDTGWNEPELLPLFSDTCNVLHPFLTSDGKELYVSADVEGGYGGKDIYVFTLQLDGRWGNPRNLGSSVNTEGDEIFPFIGPDQRLYFASNGHAGMGGFDLYVASRLQRQWGNVQNLKPPFNSGADDLSLVLEPLSREDQRRYVRRGIFASNRPGGKGNDDLYLFWEEKKKVYLLSVQVVEKLFERPNDPNSAVIGFKPLVDQPIHIQEVNTQGQPLGAMISLRTNEQGTVLTALGEEKMYRLSVSRPDYFTRTETANTKDFAHRDEDTILINMRVVMDRIYRDVEINLPNIYYDYDKATIRADARPVLDTLAALLLANPHISIEIGSHTDARGSAAYNQRLSQARAQSVVNYLTEKGVSPDRLSARGYGESLLVNRCSDGVPCTEEEHQQNRRTTFKVTAVRPTEQQ
ncbi:MAG: OmpA family protein [Chitinophagales bacterium]|nr:OmpA family protein [Chitinophagales bacterium]MDW8427527.1 OmpA family protein [Chitinophagales bacterium]